MFSYYVIELIAYERRKELQQKVERRRLIKMLQHQQSNNRQIIWRVSNWMGTQMVQWGLKLQGHHTTPSHEKRTLPIEPC